MRSSYRNVAVMIGRCLPWKPVSDGIVGTVFVCVRQTKKKKKRQDAK